MFQFTVHSDLGRVVQAVIREFERFPPNFYNDTSSPNNFESNPAMYSQQQPQQQLPYGMAAGTNGTTMLPELADLTIEDLQKLDSDPEYLNDFIEELTVVQQLNNELDTLINEVESISGIIVLLYYNVFNLLYKYK